MASKKEDAKNNKPRTARGSGKRGEQHAATQAKKPTSGGTGNPAEVHGQETPAAPSGTTDQPPPGLDTAKHAAAQRAAHQAVIMKEALFPALMADALGFDIFESGAYKVYMNQLLQDAGNPKDPIEKMMLEQLALAHFRIGQLHVNAGKTKTIEATKIYNSAASRLLGEFRRTALAVRAYRTRIPDGKPEKTLKLFKSAQ